VTDDLERAREAAWQEWLHGRDPDVIGRALGPKFFYEAGAEWGIAAERERVHNEIVGLEDRIIVEVETRYEALAEAVRVMRDDCGRIDYTGPLYAWDNVLSALATLESLGAPILNEIPITEGGSQ
jgi:hypothetical protein